MKALASDIRSASQHGSVVWIDFLWAIAELLVARWRLRSQGSVDYLNARCAPLDEVGCRSTDLKLVARVTYAIPRMAERVPWRADCLIQAIAAQSWLQKKGVPTRICVGVPNNSSNEFEPHAWLSIGDKVILGGDVSKYYPLLPLSD